MRLMGEEGGVGGTHVMHGRSRMTIDPRIPPTPGRSTSGFLPTTQTLLERCWASRVKGEPYATKNRLCKAKWTKDEGRGGKGEGEEGSGGGMHSIGDMYSISCMAVVV